MDFVGAGCCLKIYPFLYNRNQHNVNTFPCFLSAWQPPERYVCILFCSSWALFFFDGDRSSSGHQPQMPLPCCQQDTADSRLCPSWRIIALDSHLVLIIARNCGCRDPLQHLHAPQFDLQDLGQLFLLRTYLGLQISPPFRDVHFQICYSLFLSFFIQF